MGHADDNAAFERLGMADPEAARIFQETLAKMPRTIGNRQLIWIVEEILWALSLTPGFGREAAGGYARLIAAKSENTLSQYRRAMRKAGEIGPALGRSIARFLPGVMLENDPVMLEKFETAVRTITCQGFHTLNAIMEGLERLLSEGDSASAMAFLDLLPTAFGSPLSYHQHLNLSVLLPKTAVNFPPARRQWQIRALIRVIRADIRLAEPFLEGIENGLHLLNKEALDRFIRISLERHRQYPSAGAQFLSLTAVQGRELFASLQVSIPISAVQAPLNRYLRARIGIPISIQPLSALRLEADDTLSSDIRVCSDGRFIYLPDEIGQFDTREENRLAYHLLAKIESGFYEFDSFEFDLEKVAPSLYNDVQNRRQEDPLSAEGTPELSDFHRFFQCFPCPLLAEDLLNIFEQGRIRLLFESRYPGLAGSSYPFLRQEARHLHQTGGNRHPLLPLYSTIALGMPPESSNPENARSTEIFNAVSAHFSLLISEKSSITESARMVRFHYKKIASFVTPDSTGHETGTANYTRLATPYGLRLRPDLFFTAHSQSERLARRIRAVLNKYGINRFQSEVRREIIRHNGTLTRENLHRLLMEKNRQQNTETEHRISAVLSSPEVLEFTSRSRTRIPDLRNGDETVFRYPEWDVHLGDYLKDHVRVLEKKIGNAECRFYDETLIRYQGLTSRIRYAFEFLKPEGLTILRRWREGEAFDYRALLDFAVDRKAGLIPSDRLYTKRIKQQRDVAVLLLVDLSRSTASQINGNGVRVMDVEKEAMILFCEALEIVGDTYAIAGFSGTGPLGVDYYRIKDFDESMGERVKGRICAMAPKQSTRMGAAIRHATHCLETAPAKVRLMIILGDGFPNDLDYKSTYAVEDTRSAVNEARGKQILTKAITVNMGQDPKLDDLYGSVHHYVISDIRELPDRLLQMYARLTRH